MGAHGQQSEGEVPWPQQEIQGGFRSHHRARHILWKSLCSLASSSEPRKLGNLPQEAARVHGHVMPRGCLAACHTPLGQLARAPGLWAGPQGLEHHISPVRSGNEGHSWLGTRCHQPRSTAGPREAGGHQLLCVACAGALGQGPAGSWEHQLLPEPRCSICSPHQAGWGSGKVPEHCCPLFTCTKRGLSPVHPGVQLEEGKGAGSMGRRAPRLLRCAGGQVSQALPPQPCSSPEQECFLLLHSQQWKNNQALSSLPSCLPPSRG